MYSTLSGLQDGLAQNAVINEALSHIAEYGTSFLASKMGVDVGRANVPRIIIDRKAWYLDKTVALTLAGLREEDNAEIGEETSHSNHSFVKPDHFEVYTDDMWATNLVEMVGGYGARVFSSYNHPSVQEAKQSLVGEIEKLDELEIAMLRSESLGYEAHIFDYERHEGGVEAADFLFNKFGEGHLEFFANAGVDEAIERLKSLGHSKPLFIPYGPGKWEVIIGRLEEAIANLPPTNPPFGI